MKTSRAAAPFLALALALGLGGCSEQSGRLSRDNERVATSSSAQGRRPVDTDIVAFLSKARAAHHAADLAEAKGDLELAVEHVKRIPNGPAPAISPEVKEVLADAYARLADLESRLGRFDEAAKDVDQGLAWAREITHFRGHLFEMRGVVEERRMKALEAKGDKAGAEKARLAAIAAFETAIEVQDQVIMNMLPDAPASGTPSAVPPPPEDSSARPSPSSSNGRPR